MTTIQLFQILKPRLGERETGALIEFVDTKVQENNKEMHEMNLKTLATKAELYEVRNELKTDIARLEVKIVEVKSDVVRWVFASFVVLMLAIVGLYFKH